MSTSETVLSAGTEVPLWDVSPPAAFAQGGVAQGCRSPTCWTESGPHQARGLGPRGPPSGPRAAAGPPAVAAMVCTWARPACTCIPPSANFSSVTDAQGARGTWIKPARFKTKTSSRQVSFQPEPRRTGALKEACSLQGEGGGRWSSQPRQEASSASGAGKEQRRVPSVFQTGEADPLS